AATTSIYTLSLHDALPILAFLETTANPLVLAMGDDDTATQRLNLAQAFNPMGSLLGMLVAQVFVIQALRSDDYSPEVYSALDARSEEHTSELQSRENLVCR